MAKRRVAKKHHKHHTAEVKA